MVETRIIGKNLQKARRLLNILADYLDNLGIEYHLEGGTLLGFVRDKEFLEWDYDIDISIPKEYTSKFYSGRYRLWMKGYRVTKRRSKINYGPIEKGNVRIFKVKRIFLSLFAIFSQTVRDNLLVADVFIKFTNDKDVFWIAREKVMKTSNDYYRGYEEIEYNDRKYKVPLRYKDYLTQKYGDWSVPVKMWDCASDEKVIIASVD